jgi:D-alanyl-D-alanine endopeptidase (penicillin-binding protein 7)
MTTFDAASVEALGWALVHFAWQGALAAGVFGVLSLAAHGASARVRYALAAFTLAAMALMPPSPCCFRVRPRWRSRGRPRLRPHAPPSCQRR